MHEYPTFYHNTIRLLCSGEREGDLVLRARGADPAGRAQVAADGGLVLPEVGRLPQSSGHIQDHTQVGTFSSKTLNYNL